MLGILIPMPLPSVANDAPVGNRSRHNINTNIKEVVIIVSWYVRRYYFFSFSFQRSVMFVSESKSRWFVELEASLASRWNLQPPDVLGFFIFLSFLRINNKQIFHWKTRPTNEIFSSKICNEFFSKKCAAQTWVKYLSVVFISVGYSDIITNPNHNWAASARADSGFKDF